MIRNEETHAALLARASWNSYENTCPVAPTVLAIEWVKDPEPVPKKTRVRMKIRVDRWGGEKRPASITTLPGRMYSHEVINAMSAR